MSALQSIFAIVIAAGIPTTAVLWAATQVINHGPRTHP